MTVVRSSPAGAPSSPLIERIRAGVIGEGEVLDGPYGPRRVTYADHTASGRALDFVEDHIRRRVLPWYANTHTESSATGRITGRLREEARRTVARAVGAGPGDLVVFCGSGTTGAVNKLVGILGLRLPAQLDRRYGLTGRIPPDERPVVFVGPYEHHSNELPWRETIADVVAVDADTDGHIDLAHLREELVRHAHRPLRIGSFSAASNVTGILSDTGAVSRLLHAHGALSLWDYAAAGPYVPIRMGESAPGRGDHKDAVFLSPHKFIGGPQTPGVLVVRGGLVTDGTPTAPGGGTVAFVDPSGHRYLDDPVAREEGGTPAIVESIRAGLVLGLKEQVGTNLITARERRLWHRALRRWRTEENIELLGDTRADRLSIVSFRIRSGRRHLHHNFVVALLNDLFGIQARGGCSCAGPYGHRLLGIDDATSLAFRDLVTRGYDGFKPGWTRITLTYFMSDTVADYLLDAVALIAEHGHRLLTDYRFDPRSGLWSHHAAAPAELPGLGMLGDPAEAGDHRTLTEQALAGHLTEGRHLLTAHPATPGDDDPPLPAGLEALRWFRLPRACLEPATSR